MISLRRFIFVLFCLLIMAPFVRAQKQAATAPDGVSVKREIVYSTIAKRELHLFLARPNPMPKTALPVVIYLHGGAWRNGSYENLASGAWQLAQSGFAVVAVEFRSSDEAIYPAPIDDCRAAIGWIKKNAKNYSLDPNKIGVYGVSTGGHLAALLALTSSTVKCAAIESAPSDLPTLSEGSQLDWNAASSPLGRFLGGAVGQKAELARRASPIFYADEFAPPMLLLHGDADEFVPIGQSEKLYRKLKAAGASVEYRVFAGEAHGLKNQRDEADAVILKFFQRQLK